MSKWVYPLLTFIGIALAPLCDAKSSPAEAERALSPQTAPNQEAVRAARIDPEAPVVATVGDVAFRECTVSTETRDRRVQCAWVEVPETRLSGSDESDATLALFVVRLPARRSGNTADDPVVLISGGPGQAASRAWLFADQLYKALSKNRDFYLIDQRGTGDSHPLECPALEDDAKLWVGGYDGAKVKALTRRCLASLAGRVASYTTDNTVKDLEQVREALGLELWNLLGVSYGTRVATHYMREFPGSVRTAVLDSVVPPQKHLGPEIAQLSQRAFDTLLDRCQSAPACAEAMPALGDEVAKLFARLEAAPETVRYEDFASGGFKTMHFTRQHLAMVLRMYLYDTYSTALLPPMLHAAAVEGNFAPLARTAIKQLEGLQHLAVGLHNSVMCTEDVPAFQLDDELLEANADTYMGDSLIRQLKDICSVWPQGRQIPGFHDPLAVAVPVLLLSGEHDPITPPSYAELAMAELSNARHLVLPGQGHFVSNKGCAPDLIENFIRNASSEGFNPDCLERLAAAPLFLNFNAPAP